MELEAGTFKRQLARTLLFTHISSRIIGGQHFGSSGLISFLFRNFLSIYICAI